MNEKLRYLEVPLYLPCELTRLAIRSGKQPTQTEQFTFVYDRFFKTVSFNRITRTETNNGMVFDTENDVLLTSDQYIEIIQCLARQIQKFND